MNFIQKYKYYMIIVGAIMLILMGSVGYYFFYEEAMPIVIPKQETEMDIIPTYVDVKGAVKKPGVYEFVSGEMVIDAINKAGGLAKNGNTSNINLSQKLTDAMVVYVFTSAEIKKGSTKITCDTTCSCETITVDNGISAEKPAGKISINTASLATLMTLPGIGEAKATAIVDYRTQNGLFTNIDDLLKVSGIGQSTFDSLKDLITI